MVSRRVVGPLAVFGGGSGLVMSAVLRDRLVEVGLGWLLLLLAFVWLYRAYDRAIRAGVEPDPPE